MKKLPLLSLLVLFAFCAGAQQRHIEPYSAKRLMARASSQDTIYILNFWATWCAPCVKELPEFGKVDSMYKNKPVKVILSSFDFKDNQPYPATLKAFVAKRPNMPEVVWFTDTRANDFIPLIDTAWSGSLPATLVWQPRTKYHHFMERPITAEELSHTADSLLSVH